MSFERIEWIDNLKGVGIFLVVLGHLQLAETSTKIIYSFHMPLFFFISGFLFKIKSNEAFRTRARKKAINLIRPYFIFEAISILFTSFVSIVKGGKLPALSDTLSELFYLEGTVGWNSPLWFLVVLFFVELIFSVFKSPLYKMTISFVGLIGGFLLSLINTNFIIGINAIFIGVFFYGFGYILRKHSIIEKLGKHKLPSIVSTSSFLVLNIVISLINQPVSIYENVVGNYFYFIVAALSGVLFMVIVFSKTRSVKILEFYGKNTLFIMGTHYFFLFVYGFVNANFFNGEFLSNDPLYIGIPIALCIFLMYIPLIKFVNRYLFFSQTKSS